MPRSIYDLSPAERLSLSNSLSGFSSALSRYQKGGPGGSGITGDFNTNPATPARRRYVEPASVTAERERLNAQRTQVNQDLNETPEARNQRIKDETRTNMQTRIDAINNFYTTERAVKEKQGKEGENRTRALNLNAGLGGSPFASAAATKAEEVSADLLKNVDAERGLKLQEVYGLIDTNAEERIKAEQDRIAGDQEAYLSSLDKFQSRAQEALKSLGASGTTWEDFTTYEPDRADQLAKDSGLSEDEIKAMLVANRPKEEFVSSTPEIVTGQDGQRKAIYFLRSIDPKTNQYKIRQEEVALPASAADKKVKDVRTTDNGLYVIYDDGSWQHIGGSGKITKPKAPASTTLTANERQQLYNANLSDADINGLLDDIKNNPDVTLDDLLKDGNLSPDQESVLRQILRGGKQNNQPGNRTTSSGREF